MYKTRFKPGSYVALVTPFKRVSANTYEIDWETVAKLIEFHAQNGTTGIVVSGCTGQAFTLSIEEQKKLIIFAAKYINGRMVFIPGTGANDTAQAIELTACAKEAKADGAILITPYGNKPMPTGLLRHYLAIAKAVDIPIMLYNVPGRTGLNMKPETVKRLYEEIPSVVAIKEASGDVDQVCQILNLCGIQLFCGDDSLTLPMMSIGAEGVVSVTANICPDRVAALVAATLNGDRAEAIRLHHELYPLHKVIFVETNPGPVQAALALMGKIPSAYCRPPLSELEPMSLARLHDELLRQKLVMRSDSR